MQTKSKSSKKFEYHRGMKKHEVLKEAMKYISPVNSIHLKGNKHEYICYAIGSAINSKNPYNQYHPIMKDIKDRLEGYTFSDWLYVKHNISFDEQYLNKGRKLQATRRAWMQSMYEEFLEKDE